jgi:hypothetical protein
MAIWGELADLAGGAGALVGAARAHLSDGRPLHALHFTDIALARQPADPGALEVKLAALRQLLDGSGQENFSEVAWLGAEIRDVQEAMSQ